MSKILSINTTGVGTQITLRCDGDLDTVDAGFSKHSETFFPLLEELLSRNKICTKDLDYIAVVTGPGSFTGIRIGLSVAKSFCYVHNIPCIPLNAMEVLSYSAFDQKVVVGDIIGAVINAGAGLVYHQFFSVVDTKNCELRPISNPDVSKFEHFKGLTKAFYSNAKILYNASNEKVGIDLDPNYVITPFSPAALDRASLDALHKGNAVEQNAVMPLYIRGSQAEQIVLKEQDLCIVDCTMNDIEDIKMLENQGDTEDCPWSEKNILDMFKNSAAKSFIIRHKDKAVGYLVYLDLGEQYEIERIVVVRGARLQGVAKNLLSNLFSRARDNGVKEILLEVNQKNYPAYRLYSKLGFEGKGVRRDYYAVGKDAILMTKTIVED